MNAEKSRKGLSLIWTYHKPIKSSFLSFFSEGFRAYQDEQTVRYCGYYSNVSRGRRQKKPGWVDALYCWIIREFKRISAELGQAHSDDLWGWSSHVPEMPWGYNGFPLSVSVPPSCISPLHLIAFNYYYPPIQIWSRKTYNYQTKPWMRFNLVVRLIMARHVVSLVML